MKMISYAQNHEDVVLDRAFPRDHKGFYIDIGAADPVHDSVTKHFYDLGWHGMNVEPMGFWQERLRSDRADEINLQVGVSDTDGELCFWEGPPEHPGGSTFSSAVVEAYGGGLGFTERTVQVTTLARLCEDHVGDRTIDFLKVDVEGHELQVLQGAGWARWRPRVVVVEATRPNTTEPSHDRWEHLLLAADYVFALFDGLNRFYVRAEEPDLLAPLSVSPNYFDDFVPYRFVTQLDQRDAQINQLAAELASTTLAISDLRPRLRRTQESLNDAHVELVAARSALRATAAELDRVKEASVPLARRGPAALHVGRVARLAGERFPVVASLARRLSGALARGEKGA